MAWSVPRESLAKTRWRDKDLELRRKGDGVKMDLARRLQVETTMTSRQIANRLQMGSWTYVSNLLRQKQ